MRIHVCPSKSCLHHQRRLQRFLALGRPQRSGRKEVERTSSLTVEEKPPKFTLPTLKRSEITFFHTISCKQRADKLLNTRSQGLPALLPKWT
jgi:hypothetical protein